MSIKHKTRRKPSVKTARDSRRAVHKYYPAGEMHSHAVPAGRCQHCGKITDCFCDKCNIWTCEKHLQKKDDLDFCKNCLD